jgi:hypothetical protein
MIDELPRTALQFLDWGFLIFHSAIILFNCFGWIWKRTRLGNLVCLLLTGASWTLLGIWYGLGYCPFTEWHWQVKYRLGVTDLPRSYLKWMVDAPTGLDVSAYWTDVVAVVVFGSSLVISITLNARDWRRRRRDQDRAST